MSLIDKQTYNDYLYGIIAQKLSLWIKASSNTYIGIKDEYKQKIQTIEYAENSDEYIEALNEIIQQEKNSIKSNKEKIREELKNAGLPIIKVNLDNFNKDKLPLSLSNDGFYYSAVKMQMVINHGIINKDILDILGDIINGKGYNLTGSDFSQVEFENANLKGAVLERVNFRSANLKKANLIQTNLRLANLEDANLTGAKLEGADLRQALLAGAILEEAGIKGVNCSGADLKGVNLQKRDLRTTNFEGTDLRRVNFSYCDLRKVNLLAANLIQAILIKADLRGANLVDVCLRDADLTNANLTDADLELADLNGADFTEADLRGANLERVTVNVVSIRQTKERAKFINANLEKVNLKGAELQGVLFNRANLTKANFSGANLEGVYFDFANLQGANFKDAFFSNRTLFFNREELGNSAKSLIENRFSGIKGISIEQIKRLGHNENLTIADQKICGRVQAEKLIEVLIYNYNEQIKKSENNAGENTIPIFYLQLLLESNKDNKAEWEIVLRNITQNGPVENVVFV